MSVLGGDLTTSDVLALAWFLLAWIGYGLAVEHTRLAPRTLNARMDALRSVWMQRMIERELRIVDTTIMASLQNGTAFFASTSLLESRVPSSLCVRSLRSGCRHGLPGTTPASRSA